MPTVCVWFHKDELRNLDLMANRLGLTRSRMLRVAAAAAERIGITPEAAKRYVKERRGGRRGGAPTAKSATVALLPESDCGG